VAKREGSYGSWLDARGRRDPLFFRSLRSKPLECVYGGRGAKAPVAAGASFLIASRKPLDCVYRGCSAKALVPAGSTRVNGASPCLFYKGKADLRAELIVKKHVAVTSIS
jgi:hypothetical protein